MRSRSKFEASDNSAALLPIEVLYHWITSLGVVMYIGIGGLILLILILILIF